MDPLTVCKSTYFADCHNLQQTPPPPSEKCYHHEMRFLRSLALTIALVLVAVAAMSPSDVLALPSYGPAGNQYSDASCSGSDCKCVDCHIGDINAGGCGSCSNFPCWNINGVNYYLNGWSYVMGQNWDGDGTVASQMSGTGGGAGVNGSPAFPAAVENAGCSMLSCATNGTQSCGNINCTGTQRSIAGPLYYYTFGFTCAAHTAGMAAGASSWCADINECLTATCAAGRTCHQIALSSWVSPGYTCDVSDACAASGTGAANCSANSTCSYKNGNPTVGVCTCNTGYQGDGTQAGTGCSPIDQCKKADGADLNPCNNSGDTAAACATKTPYSTNTYTCDCNPASLPAFDGYTFNNVSCVLDCNPGVTEPCGNGGMCKKSGPPNQWTCMCPTGYSAIGTTQQACTDTDGCNGATACVTGEIGNTCGDVKAPGTGYTCACANAAYELSMDKQSCENKDECKPTNHCADGGDTAAACHDNPAPLTGWDCTCSSAGWEKKPVAGGFECDDVNECAATDNPCQNGTCTNIPDGGGYSCVCDFGYVLGGTATNPVCLVDYCNAAAKTACNTAQVGNTCVNLIPPQKGYVCDCLNAAYTTSPDDQFCINKNDSGKTSANNCTLGGDTDATCDDNPPPKTGYGCECSNGFQFDGTTCIDLDECASGTPCGAGTCTNTAGSYACACVDGAQLIGNPPTCVGATHVTRPVMVTEVKGTFCSATGAAPDATALATFLLLSGAVLITRRRVVSAVSRRARA